VRAYQSLPLFRGECSLASWLYRIVFNLSRNRCGYFSRRHRGDTYSFDAAISENNGATFKDLIAGDQPDPAREETNREFLALVKVCMRQLSEAQRKILVLRNHENYSYEIIAETLNLSPGMSVTLPLTNSETAETNLMAGSAGETNSLAELPDARVVGAQKEAARRIHEFVQNTRSGTLGTTGMILLIIAAISLLARIEETFNG